MAKSEHSAQRAAALVHQMRDDIRFGDFEFGQWLKLTNLQKQYDASQHEVRRALAELKGEGVVEHKANAGFRVAMPDTSDRAEMVYVRSVLERSAAPLIAAKATDEDVERLEALAAEFDRSILSDGRRNQAACNAAFHHCLYSIAGNELLIELIHNLRERSHFGTTGRWRSTEGLAEASHDHMRIVEAIRKRDPTELERLIMHHIRSF